MTRLILGAVATLVVAALKPEWFVHAVEAVRGLLN